MSKRVSKPSKKAASPFPEDAFDEEEPDVEVRQSAPAKKRKNPKAKPAPVYKDTSSDEDDEPKPKPAKKRKYSPKKGTANHAFMVVLLEAHNNGEETLTKQEIMERAEKSGLAEKPIFGNEDSKSPAGFPVDGWTNFKTLKSHALVVAEGRPLRVHLTSEGKSVAQGLVD